MAAVASKATVTAFVFALALRVSTVLMRSQVLSPVMANKMPLVPTVMMSFPSPPVTLSTADEVVVANKSAVSK